MDTENKTTSKEFFKEMIKMSEKMIVDSYLVFLASQETAKRMREKMKNNPFFDEKRFIFATNNNFEDGKILLIEDYDMKKHLLIQEGIIKQPC